MNHATAMIKSYPKNINNDRELFASSIEKITDCAQTCTACADACLSEDMVKELTKCIRSNLDCADIRDATGRVLSRHKGLRCQYHESRFAGLRAGVQELRRRTPKTRDQARALPRLRRNLPRMRERLPGSGVGDLAVSDTWIRAMSKGSPNYRSVFSNSCFRHSPYSCCSLACFIEECISTPRSRLPHLLPRQ